MNLPPRIAELLTTKGLEAIHWKFIGKMDAKDTELMSYARQHNLIVLTCDLDFTAILSTSKQSKPSVIQIRTQSFEIERLAEIIVIATVQNAEALNHGAILTIDTKRARLRLLPLT